MSESMQLVKDKILENTVLGRTLVEVGCGPRTKRKGQPRKRLHNLLGMARK